MKRRTISRFEPGSYGERCAKFFEGNQEWEKRSEQDLASRAVTWAQYPNRYVLTQYGREAKQMLRPKIVHAMFQVAILSAARTDTGTRDLQRWNVVQPYLHRPETVMYFSYAVGTLEEERATGEVSKNTEFMIDHGLYVPNTHDLDSLDAILERGWLDGHEPLLSS